MRETTIESHIMSSTISRTMERHTPTFASPPDTTSPPFMVTSKRNQSNGDNLSTREREGSEAVDANLLSERLKEFKEGARSREITPSGSPSRKRPRLYADRSVTHLHPFPITCDVTGTSWMAFPTCFLEASRCLVSPRMQANGPAFVASYLNVAATTYKPISVSCLTKRLQQHPREQSGGRRMESFISRRVRPSDLTVLKSWSNSFQPRKPTGRIQMYCAMSSLIHRTPTPHLLPYRRTSQRQVQITPPLFTTPRGRGHPQRTYHHHHYLLQASRRPLRTRTFSNICRLATMLISQAIQHLPERLRVGMVPASTYDPSSTASHRSNSTVNVYF